MLRVEMEDTKSLFTTSSNTDHFQNALTGRFGSKFVIKQSTKILSDLKRIATLPSEILMSAKRQQPQAILLPPTVYI